VDAVSDLFIDVTVPTDEAEGVVVILADGTATFEAMPGTVAQPADLTALLTFPGNILPGLLTLRAKAESIRTRLLAPGLKVSAS
jgi:hypothetical protein